MQTQRKTGCISTQLFCLSNLCQVSFCLSVTTTISLFPSVDRYDNINLVPINSTRPLSHLGLINEWHKLTSSCSQLSHTFEHTQSTSFFLVYLSFAVQLYFIYLLVAILFGRFLAQVFRSLRLVCLCSGCVSYSSTYFFLSLPSTSSSKDFGEHILQALILITLTRIFFQLGYYYIAYSKMSSCLLL